MRKMLKNFDIYCDNNIRDTVLKLIAKNLGCKDKIYHYTSTKVLDQILETAIFRASDIFYLNDSEEYKTGCKELMSLAGGKTSDIVKSMEVEDGKNICGLFTISFSKEQDSLHQWITYAKESGVAIEFDYEIEKLEYLYEQNDQDFSKCDALIVDLLYLKNDKKRFIKQVKKAIGDLKEEESDRGSEENKEYLYNMLMRIAATYIKNDKFKDEEEARITITPQMFSEKEYQTKINYFPMDSGVLRPYINIKIVNGENPCLPLRSLTVGPSGIQQTVFDSVVHRLKYGECNIYNYFVNNKNSFLKNFFNYLLEANSLPLPDKEGSFKWDDKEGIVQLFQIAEKFKGQTQKLVTALIYDWIICNEEYLSKLRAEVEGIDKYGTEYPKNVQDKIKKIKQNFYFTKEGVLIRKSKIPYIF